MNPIRFSLLPIVALAIAADALSAATRQSEFTYASQVSGAYELRTFDPGTGARSTCLTGVTFLPLELAGEARKDHLRRGAPHAEAFGALGDRIALANGDMLYRVARAGSTELLLVPAAGAPRVLLSHPGSMPPSIEAAVHVAANGSRAAVATTDGEVIVVQLAAPFGAHSATATLAPLGISARSLRLSSSALWFVADCQLYRAAPPLGGAAAIVDLGVPEVVEHDLVLAADGGAVVAAAVEAGNDPQRRLFLVRASGPPIAASETSFKRIAPAGLQHPLGPFIAVAPDASIVAWRETGGGDHELKVRFMGAPGGAATGSPVRLTGNSEFANYIDSIGVLAFANPTTLCFFAGDRNVGGFVHDERLAASDMYAVDFSSPSALVFVNVTRTSTQASPPFVLTGNLAFNGATVGPDAARIHLDEADGQGRRGHGSFRVNGGQPGGPNFERDAEELARAAEVIATAHGVLLATTPLEPSPLFAMSAGEVTCSGDPLEAQLVRILVTNKDNPYDHGARVYFDDIVQLGGSFEAHSLAAGEVHFPGDVRVHVLTLGGAPLQFVKFKSDCNQPLQALDRFGAVVLLGAIAESAPAGGRTDHCLSGSRPTVVSLRYHGGDCAATSHLQDPSKVRCSGNAGGAPSAWIRATDKENPSDPNAHVWFEGQVTLGDEFELRAAAAGEARLKADTWVHVLSAPSASSAAVHSVRFHTSCSQPLVGGDRFGAFELIDCTLEEPPLPGDLCAAGRPRTLRFSYVGYGCSPIELGPILTLQPTNPILAGSTAPGRPTSSTWRGPVAVHEFERGVALDRFTPSRNGGLIGLIASERNGLESAYLLHSGRGILLPLMRDVTFGACLGFAPSGALLLPVVESAGHSLVLVPVAGLHTVIDSGPGPILPLVR